MMGISTSGPRRLVLLYDWTSRAQDWYGIRSYPDLCEHRFSMLDEDPDNPQRLAEVMLDGAPLQKASLDMRPALVHIRLRSLKADFSHRSYRDLDFYCETAYLGYAVTECQPLSLKSARPAPLSWVNCGYLDYAASDKFPHPEMLYREDIGVIGPVKRDLSLDFYCYPSSSLLLVLYGWIGPKDCFYPIDLGPVSAGETYELDLTLTRKGVETPYEPLQAGTVTGTPIVEPWWQYDPMYLCL